MIEILCIFGYLAIAGIFMAVLEEFSVTIIEKCDKFLYLEYDKLLYLLLSIFWPASLLLALFFCCFLLFYNLAKWIIKKIKKL